MKFFTLVVGIAVVIVAWLQWSVALNKLRLDLFDRRYKVYDAAKKFILQVLRDWNFDDSALVEFDAGTSDAEFLFDDDVVLFLRQTRELAWQTRDCRRLLEHKQGDERTDLAKIGDASFAWITEQFSTNKFTAVFNPYLGFANVRLKALPPLNLLWRKRYYLFGSTPTADR